MFNENVAKSVIPSIAASILRAKESQGYQPAPQTCGIVAVAVFNLMCSFTVDDELTLEELAMLATSALDSAHRRNNDMKEYHFAGEPINIVGLAKHFGYIKREDNGSFAMTERWVELTTTKETSIAFTTKVTEENRRKPYVKGGKVRPSNLLKEAIGYLQDTEYHVDAAMYRAITSAFEMVDRSGVVIPEDIKSEKFVYQGARRVLDAEVLHSDYFADNRGRLYHVAAAGPNPQSSDYARSLYSHNVENNVQKGSPAYDMFMAELEDISGGKWMNESILTRAAKNPSGALFAFIKNPKDAPKKPFTYVRLAMDWLKFEETGFCDSRVGFGLDAKCSGTQYLAFIAGDVRMSQATGLVATDTKSLDPYQLSLIELKKLLERSSIRPTNEIMEKHLNPKDGRSFIKTPYMAIQYGGSEAALLGSNDFVEEATPIVGENNLDTSAELCVKAIKIALGPKINMFIDKVAESVARELEVRGKQYLEYKHSDGLRVRKPAMPEREVCDAFSVRVHDRTRVIFGSQKDKKPWTIRETTPTATEFVRTFVVNYVQGIDALVARTVTKHAKQAGLRGFTSIHDCFRCCLEDAPRMMDVIRSAYKEVFVDTNQFEHLAKQIGGISMFHKQIVTEELLNSEHAYYFCQ